MKKARRQNGRAIFAVPAAAYKIRADYMGAQYWSEEFNQANSDISIRHGGIDLHIMDQYGEVIGARVYLFSESGTYLHCSDVSGDLGHVRFSVPEGSYLLRVDRAGQHWSDVVHVISYQTSFVELDINEESATNNPRPTRFDGKAPVYYPLLASIGSLGHLFTNSLVGEPRTYYYINDHLGTGQLLVNGNREIIWQASYSPFGQVDIVVDQVIDNFRFPGQYFDEETGLHYNWHRYYDPDTGRYISADPIGLDGGINLFAYVGGNPVNAIDPWGLAKYTAIVSFNAAGYIGGGAVMWGSVETECVDGKKQTGLVTAAFAGADVGVPLSSTAFTMELSDNASGMGDLQNLDGFARVFSLSGALGGGLSISNMILGSAETDGVDVGVQLGFDLGAIGMSGWSHVFSIKEKDCGCKE